MQNIKNRCLLNLYIKLPFIVSISKDTVPAIGKMQILEYIQFVILESFDRLTWDFLEAGYMQEAQCYYLLLSEVCCQ